MSRTNYRIHIHAGCSPISLLIDRSLSYIRCIIHFFCNLTFLSGIGIALGFGMNAFCILIASLNKDICLYFDSFKPVSFLILFLMVFIQSSAEELVCRGYLYQKLIKSYKNPLVAIIGNALFFGLLHLLNPGITI